MAERFSLACFGYQMILYDAASDKKDQQHCERFRSVGGLLAGRDCPGQL